MFSTPPASRGGSGKTMTTAPSPDRELIDYLADRVSPLHLRRRLGLEDDIETRRSGRAGGPQRFTLERWLLAPGLIKTTMRLVFLYNRARRNALNIVLRHNRVIIPGLPAPFAGYKILQVSDPTLRLRPGVPRRPGGGGRRHRLRPVRVHRRLPVSHLRPDRSYAGRRPRSLRPAQGAGLRHSRAITTRCVWCRRWRRWEYVCC